MIRFAHAFRAVMALAAISALAQEPVGTAITFQGRLDDGGVPYDGVADFQVTPFDALVGGAQAGPVRTVTAVAVVDGVFTLRLDFGPGVFTNEARWLDMRVRAPSGVGSFVTLTPRPVVMPTPFALHAERVTDGLTGSGATNRVPKFGSSAALTSSIISEVGGQVGIGTDSPDASLDVHGVVQADLEIGGGGFVWTRGPNGEYNAGITFLSGLPNHGAIAVRNASGTTKARLYVDFDGNGVMDADIKNFRVAHPTMPDADIVYACIEGPEAAAYCRGTARLEDGRAAVRLPEHFTLVTTTAGRTIQLTPRAADSKGLAVVSRSADQFVVQELFDGAGSYEFDWRVEAVRKGYEQYQVIRVRSVDRLAEPASAAEFGDDAR